MKIKIKSIDISYFKGMRNRHIECDGDLVTIKGANGTGKTTIADAIQWCLFGKNAIGETKFGIKTLDDEGNVIPNVEHSVQLTLEIVRRQGDVVLRQMQPFSTTTIKRVWVEDKVTSRGRETDEIKHHAEFYINGEKYLKKDFDTYMAGLVNEQTFRAVTNPNYFFTLKWQDQRSLLEQMTGKVNYDGVDRQYHDVLSEIAEGLSAIEYQKHLAYNRKEIQAKLEQIPSRVDEQRKTMPDEVDESAVKQEVDELNKVIEEKQTLIANLKSGNTNAKTEAIQKQLDFARRRVENMRVGASNQVSELQRKKEEAIRSLSSKAQSIRNTLNDYQSKMQSLSLYVSRCEENLKGIDEEVVKFREEWNEVQSQKFNYEADSICPTCGQPLSPEQIAEAKEKALQNFNARKAARIEELRKKSGAIKQRQAEGQAQLKAYKEELKLIDLDKAENDYKEAQGVLEEAMKEELPTMDSLLNANGSWRCALAEMHELELKLQGEIVADNSDTIKNLEGEVKEKRAELSAKMLLMGNSKVRESHLERIKELEQEQEALNKQLDQIMLKEDKVAEYLQACDELLEESVNEHFKMVVFHLFEKLNDGTKKPNCVAWIKTSEGLVPYTDANRAMQINAGRDVLNSLSRYYDLYAPCISDNSEAVNEFEPIHSQDFRFYVTTNKELEVMA